jgi:phosphoribosylformimino-5-aminoimidazole carboxamide ribotide isomerase
MIVIPSIDILGGRCVRLLQGRYDAETRYSDHPEEVARGFAAAGARRIHLVDLDAARGSGSNREVVRAIRESVSCSIEVGGGVRSERDIVELEALGVERIVVGTMLVKEPETVRRWAAGRRNLIAGIDARDGEVKVSGWTAGSDVRDEELAARARDIGMIGIIYTDIGRDGTLAGASVEGCVRIARASGLPVILSGGVASLDDLDAASQHPEIAGAILGRAIYEGRIDVRSAIERYDTDGEREEVTW